MAFSVPLNKVRLYAINHIMPVSEPYIIEFDLSKYIDFPLIISDSEFSGNYGSNYIQFSPSENDLTIANQYSLSFKDIYSRYNEITPFTLPGDNTNNITPTSTGLYDYRIPNPSITYPSGESGGIVGYTYGKNGPFYADANQKMFFVVTPSGRISPGIVVYNRIDICVYGTVGDGAYYWETDYIYPLKKVTGLKLSPSIPYISKDEEIQFTLEAEFDDGSVEDVTNEANWGLGRNTIDEPVSELDGFTISQDGLLTAVNPTASKIVVSAVYEGRGQYTTVTVSSPSNAYETGGFSGTSFGGGSYNNTFGPNISSGLPGQTIIQPPAVEGDPDIIIQTGAAGNDVSDSGMYTKYLCNQDYLNLLAQFFWEDNVGIQALKTIFGNPIDSVISLMAYPFDLTTLVATRQQNFFFGKYDSQLSGIAVTKSSIQIDWGTIEIPFYWGNFLDYAPYTQVQLYLPWGVGFVTIDPNEIMPYPNNAGDFNIVNYNPGTIRVVTNIELDKGGCVHNVIGNRGLVIGSFGGICGKQIPMTALDQSAKMLALMGAASGVGMAAGNAMANALSGKYTDVTPKYHIGLNGQVNRVSFEHSFNAKEMGREMGNSRTMKAGLASAAALAHTPPNYPRAGTFSDATNALSIQTPYIIISRPSQSVPTSYGAYNGYPSNIYYNSLSRLSGYTEISEIHLDGVPATLEEITELESLLKGGVLL